MHDTAAVNLRKKALLYTLFLIDLLMQFGLLYCNIVTRHSHWGCLRAYTSIYGCTPYYPQVKHNDTLTMNMLRVFGGEGGYSTKQTAQNNTAHDYDHKMS